MPTVPFDASSHAWTYRVEAKVFRPSDRPALCPSPPGLGHSRGRRSLARALACRPDLFFDPWGDERLGMAADAPAGRLAHRAQA